MHDQINVVRCKNCKQFGKMRHPRSGIETDYCHLWGMFVYNPNKFCDKGEVKEKVEEKP